jgi:uroporphyrin-III C-methyltransferase
MVARATWPHQQVVTGTLDSVADAADEADIEPPAVTVIGDVAGTRETALDFLATTYE